MCRLAREQAKRIFIIAKTFPKEEKYSLTDQIRRSSRAVDAMVAEAWVRRRYPTAFVNKIDEADHAFDCNYLDRNQHRELDNVWQHIGAMLNGMIERADDFCKPARK